MDAEALPDILRAIYNAGPNDASSKAAKLAGEMARTDPRRAADAVEADPVLSRARAQRLTGRRGD
jgi:hypothetical protein